MRKNSIRNLILTVSFVMFASGQTVAFAAGENTNTLNKISFKKLSGDAIEVNLETQKKLPSPPLLFEKAKNIYFVSLPATTYNGNRKIDVGHYNKELKSVTVDFVLYKTAKDTGYTRIVFETSDKMKLNVNNTESFATKAIALLMLKILAGLAAAGAAGAGIYLYFKKLKDKKKLTNILDIDDDAFIENAYDELPIEENETETDDSEILTYIDSEEILPANQEENSVQHDFETEEPTIEEEIQVEKVELPSQEVGIDEDETVNEEDIPVEEEVPPAVETDNFDDLIREEDNANDITEIIEEEQTEENFVVEDNIVEDETVNKEDIPVEEEIPPAEETDNFDDLINEEDEPSEIAQNLYPSADEMVNDILNNETAITEIAENVLNNVTDVENNDQEEVEDISDALNTEKDNMADNRQAEQYTENDFKSVKIVKNSAGSVFTPKTFDLTPKTVNENKVTPAEQPKENEDFINTDNLEFEEPQMYAEDENTNITEEVLSFEEINENDLHEFLTEEFHETRETAENSLFNIEGLDAVMGGIPSDYEFKPQTDETVTEEIYDEDGSDFNDIIQETVSAEIEMPENTEPEIIKDIDDFDALLSLEEPEKQNVLSDVDVPVFNDDKEQITEEITSDEVIEPVIEQEENQQEVLSEANIQEEQVIEETTLEVIPEETRELAFIEESAQEVTENNAEEDNKEEDNKEEDNKEEDNKEEVAPIEAEPAFVIDTDNFFLDKTTAASQEDEFYKEEVAEFDTDTAEIDSSEFFVDSVKTETPTEETAIEADNNEPAVLAQAAISDEKQLYLIKHEGNVSLIGTVGEEVFILNRFENPPTKENIILKLNETKDDQNIYIVKVGAWRALISVDDAVMENILTLS